MYVVYFDWLSGAAPTWMLVKIVFGCFQTFLFFLDVIFFRQKKKKMAEKKLNNSDKMNCEWICMNFHQILMVEANTSMFLSLQVVELTKT